jgi:hypothetical protein
VFLHDTYCVAATNFMLLSGPGGDEDEDEEDTEERMLLLHDGDDNAESGSRVMHTAVFEPAQAKADDREAAGTPTAGCCFRGFLYVSELHVRLLCVV